MLQLQCRFTRVLAAFAVFGIALPASAQLDLPDRPVRDDKGRGKAEVPDRSKRPKRSLRDRVTGERGKGEEPLSLPDRGRRQNPPTTPQQPAPVVDPGLDLQRGVQTDYVFDELARVERLDDPLISVAVRTLASLGERGLVAARLSLSEEHPPTLLAALLTLIGSSDPDDWPLARARLFQPLPSGSSAELIETIIDVDPVRASPALLTRLLDHPQGSVRAVVHRRLEEVVEPSLLPLLAQPLKAKRADTRLRALDLAIAIDHPQRIDILFEMLTDSQARVARVAVETLAGLEDDQLVDRLLRKAFSSRWILRENAHALLTLVEREDLFFEPLLGGAHVEALLGGLDSSDVFVSGACASALAGIGFRSVSHSAAWLDRDVPSRLVRTVAGLDFHSDFSTLRPVAERRLALIAGETYGSDGPAWVEWWARSSGDFRARRAVLTASPEDSGKLVVRFRDGERGAGFQLVGPDRALTLADHPLDQSWGEVLILSSPQALDLFELCSREGLFGTDRLPGTRGAHPEAQRGLEVGLGLQAKAFRFGRTKSEPWFERVVEAATSLRDLNRWQRYPNPSLYESKLELWRVEGSWWNDPRPQLEKDRRLVEMILAWLPEQTKDDRHAALEELARVYARPDVAAFADLPLLIRFVRAESIVGPRLSLLVGVALEALEEDPERADSWAEELVETLLIAFDTEAAPEVARVLEAAGPGAVRSRAKDRRPFLRALAGRVLAGSEDPADRELLADLLKDPDAEVESAIVRSIGSEGVLEFSEEILVRARMGRGTVREDALRAVGDLGCEGALDALVIGLQEPNLELKAAAAEGLERLEDPQAVPVMIQLLASPRTSPMYAAAWRGLRTMGSEAWPELLRAVQSPEHRSRREVALLLAREGVPDAVPALLRLLTDAPADAVVAEELAILSCVDYRGQGAPTDAWWQWWDEVVHDDGHAWFAAALLRAGIDVPKAEEFIPPGSRAAALCCLTAMGSTNGILAERGRRELARLLDSDIGAIPPAGVDRDAWLYTLREAVLERQE